MLRIITTTLCPIMRSSIREWVRITRNSFQAAIVIYFRFVLPYIEVAQDERWHDRIAILDDATSEIYYAQLAKEETTCAVMAGLRAVMEDTLAWSYPLI
ncbi:MAG: hypothetical protein WBX22_31440 [Silvibacterium sp.]